MNNSLISQFKSGSDIRGIALDGVEGEDINLTNEVIEKICCAFARWVSEKNKISFSDLSISVGHDCRLSSFRIKNVLINTLRSIGVTVYDCSLSSTPAMYKSISLLSCTAAIQITASHHPFNRNGFKFFTSEGGVSGSDITEILKLAEDGTVLQFNKLGSVRQIDLMSCYTQELREIIKKELKPNDDTPPLKGLKIVVDAGNGVGGFFAKEILKPLGADIKGSIFLDPDGNFPNHIPNPENAEAMNCISEAVVKSSADLGIIFDTDVDRVAFVDSDGQKISKNKFIALSSYIALKNNQGGIIVTDSMTSDYLKLFIEKCKGFSFRYKRGYNNVINLAKKINNEGSNCLLAIESSGHAAFKENNFLDDGAFLAIKVIIELVERKKNGENLQCVIKDLIDAKESINLRIPFNSTEYDIQNLLLDLKNYANSNKLFELDKENIEGVRIRFNSKRQKGWALIRKSIHDPVIILYIESYVTGGSKAIFDSIQPFLKKYKFLNINEMDKNI